MEILIFGHEAKRFETTTLPLALYGMIKYGVSPVVFAMATVIFAVSFVSVTVINRLTR